MTRYPPHNDINKPFLKAINYANSISNNITALHICRHPEHAEALRKEWEELKIPCKLKIIETPYRDIIKPMDQYLWEREKALKTGILESLRMQNSIHAKRRMEELEQELADTEKGLEYYAL